VRLCLCGTAAANGPIVHLPDDTWVNMEQWWNDIDRGKTEEFGEKSDPVPLRPPQIPRGLTWARTRGPAVRSRRLTAWALAEPKNLYRTVQFEQQAELVSCNSIGNWGVFRSSGQDLLIYIALLCSPSWVQISAWGPAALIEVFCVFSQPPTKRMLR
jgi:hypothetical protein